MTLFALLVYCLVATMLLAGLNASRSSGGRRLTPRRPGRAGPIRWCRTWTGAPPPREYRQPSHVRRVKVPYDWERDQ